MDGIVVKGNGKPVALVLLAAKGKELIAEAKCLKDGRRTSLYHIDVTDDAGNYVAHFVGNGFSVGEFVK